MTWLVPGGLLSSTPKPGDIILDSTSNKWTVIDAEHEQSDNVWSMETINLALAFDLQDRCYIWRPDNTQDAAGTYNPTFTLWKSVAAKFQETSGDADEDRGKRGTLKVYEITLEENVDLEADYRLSDDSAGTNLYDINSFVRSERIDELMVVNAEQRV